MPLPAPERTDLLVVGGGIAGMTAALVAAADRDVVLLARGPLDVSSSAWAQGGIAAAVGEDDSPELHAEDTYRAGRSLCRPSAVEALVTEAPARIADLLALGVEFDEGLGLEGGHSRRRILHADGSMTWVAYNGQSEPGIFGFDEPKGARAKLADATVVILPALAVDEDGHRLGRGKGFYDRALGEADPAALLIALVHHGEVLASLPTEPHDVGIDGHIVCER